MIEKLKEVNNNLIEVHQNNPEELEKQMKIKELLNEKNIFLELDIETAYAILRDLNVAEQNLKDIYQQLI